MATPFFTGQAIQQPRIDMGAATDPGRYMAQAIQSIGQSVTGALARKAEAEEKKQKETEISGILQEWGFTPEQAKVGAKHPDVVMKMEEMKRQGEQFQLERQRTAAAIEQYRAESEYKRQQSQILKKQQEDEAKFAKWFETLQKGDSTQPEAPPSVAPVPDQALPTIPEELLPTPTEDISPYIQPLPVEPYGPEQLAVDPSQFQTPTTEERPKIGLRISPMMSRMGGDIPQNPGTLRLGATPEERAEWFEQKRAYDKYMSPDPSKIPPDLQYKDDAGFKPTKRVEVEKEVDPVQDQAKKVISETKKRTVSTKKEPSKIKIDPQEKQSASSVIRDNMSFISSEKRRISNRIKQIAASGLSHTEGAKQMVDNLKLQSSMLDEEVDFNSKKLESLKKYEELIKIREDNTLGIRLTQSDREKFSAIISAKQDLAEISQVLRGAGSSGPIIGRLKGVNPYNVSAAALNAAIDAAVPNLARGVFGEVGVLTDTDVRRYRALFPEMKTSEDIQDMLIYMLSDKLNQRKDTFINIGRNQKYRVDGLDDLYNEIELNIKTPQSGSAISTQGGYEVREIKVVGEG